MPDEDFFARALARGMVHMKDGKIHVERNMTKGTARSSVGYPLGSRPSIQANHIDGPLLHFRNGELHWLTMWERLLVRLGRADAYSLERKHRPHLCQ